MKVVMKPTNFVLQGVSQDKGIARYTVVKTDKDPQLTKEENERNATESTVAYTVEGTRDLSRPNTRRGVAKWDIRITLSRKFQSVSMEGGIEIPVDIDMDDPQGSGKAGLDLAEDILTNKMSAAMDDAEATLERVISIVGR